MNYNEFQSLCESRKLQIKDVVNAIGMSYTGLRDSLNNQSLPLKKLTPLCKLLHISPNEFLGWANGHTYNNSNVQNGDSNNMQIIQGNIDTLKEQLAVKDDQIKQLLTLLNK